jgi:two-component system phosphate regulon sensor histidine kinase PhoR
MMQGTGGNMHGKRFAELRLFAGVMGVAAGIGLLGGWLVHGLLLGALCYAAWHVYRIDALPDILRERRPQGTLFATGLWQDVMLAVDTRRHEQQQREKDLAHRLDIFHNTAAVLPDAVVMLQPDDRIIWTNAAARRLFGIPDAGTAEEALTRLVRDPILEEYLSAGSYNRPQVLSAPADRTKTLSLQVVPIGPEAQLRLLLARDISRQHHLDESHRDFIANISHELRTPLTVITGLLEQLETDLSGNDSALHITGIMQKQTVRMRDLITDLLALAQIEAAASLQQNETVPVPELLATVIETVATLAAAGRHALIADISHSHGLRGDAGELRTAFTNLVINAIRHTPDRAEIRVCWSADETGAHFSVSDTGEGIAARHIPRLTERFYRVDSSRSRDTGGTGLGLHIVRQVLHQHDASLEITSKPGHGSTFTCHFPASRVVTLAAGTR